MKENDVIWVSIEESDKYELSNYGFVRNNRYFNGYFWFKEDEPFDKNRYAPTKQISVYNRNTNKLLFTGTIGNVLNF